MQPTAVTVVLGEDTLVVTLHDALTPAERHWPRARPARPACRSFIGSFSPIHPTNFDRRSSGSPAADVREAAAEIEAATGTVVHAFTTGTMVQVFLLAKARGGGDRERTSAQPNPS